jgi:hypothetical protein
VVLVVTIGASFALPLRSRGSDTLPGRLGAVALACSGNDDVGTIEWIRQRAIRSGVPYWFAITADGRRLVSPWGPSPSWLGSLAFGSLPRGSIVAVADLLRYARRASACTVGLAAALLCGGLLRWLSPARAILWSLAAAFSIAGVGTFGQALWQQTAALPWLAAALASLSWRDHRWSLVLTPACLTALVLVRPPEVILVTGLAALWISSAVRQLDARLLALATILALVAALPFVAWNLRNFDSVLPTAQAARNTLMPVPQIGVAFLSLLVSPGRGALWFAPVLVFAVAIGLVRIARTRTVDASDLLPLALLGQIAFVSCFDMWWGGILSFGPRILGLSIWVAVAWLAESRPRLPRAASRILRPALAMTALVGLAGGALFDPAKWHPTIDTRRLWQVIDSPLPALFRDADSGFTDDLLEPQSFAYCTRGFALANVPTGPARP